MIKLNCARYDTACSSLSVGVAGDGKHRHRLSQAMEREQRGWGAKIES